MAKINMTLSGVLHYEDPIISKQTTADITLATEQTTSEIYILLKDGDSKILKFRLTLKEFSFHKKMYQPTEVLALVSITKAQGESNTYQRIDWNMLDKMFKYAKVSLKDGDFTIGDDYYVHEVLTHYQKDCMNIILKIYSLDKMMTVRQASRTFVAKKLFADILDIERMKYVFPWAPASKKDDTDKSKGLQITATSATGIFEQVNNWAKEKEEEKAVDDKTRIKCDAGSMKILRYGNTEHIFPYLVQYNESFYDMLARTTNRWGEFLFYEDNKLNIGYSATEPVEVDESDIKDIAIFDPGTKQLSIGTDGQYDYSANNSGLVGKPVQESPFIVKAQMGAFGGAVDKWIINQLTAVFKNEKNLPTLIGNLLFDNLFNLGKEKAKAAKLNSDFDKKYKFSEEHKDDVQYGKYDFAKKGEDANEKNAFQQFTEMPIRDGDIYIYRYDDKKYKYIVEKELTVGQKAIHIDYDTTHPKLKLGSIISFNGMNFIVVEILGVKSETSDMTFQVVATAQDPVDKIFYPSVIPAGHVRYAHPQPATITDVNDPLPNKNRARVMFSWQTINYEDEEKKKGITAATKELSTPWLNFASNHQGHPVLGKHYEGNAVMVGFEEGNVERPYIMGGIGDEGGRPNQDLILSSPGEHMLTLTDGTGAGMQAFLAGAFSPLFKNFTQFMPNTVPTFKWDKNKYFEGGFELTDRYGMYKISGSTDGRNVSIASNWGDVKINAFTGISISAPNGDVKISGKNVTIEAGNNLNLVSGKNVNYKLWKSGPTKKQTAAQLLIEVTAQVTKRLAQTIVDVIDLSVIRSVVEVFFRPVEGNLTLKSNRFLKLEAGDNECKMPKEAFSTEGQKKMQEALDKAAIKDAKGIGDGMIEIFNVTATLALNQCQYFVKKYNECVKDVQKVNTAISGLRAFTNKKSTAEYPVYVCKTYDELKKDLWKQEKDEDWKEDKFGFTDEVASEKETEIPQDAILYITRTSQNKWKNITKTEKDKLIETILSWRKSNKKSVVTAYNQLRKHIYELAHHAPTEQDIAIAYGHLKSPTIPKDYQKKVLAAFDPKKLEKVPCYTEIAEDLKDLDSKIYGEPTANEKEVIILRRLVIINLLEEFGFVNSSRMKLKNGRPDATGEVPEKPTVENVLDGIAWPAYLSSLSGVPTIDALKETTLGGALKDAVKGAAIDQWENKIKFWKGISERNNWSDGKNGQILFAAGHDTFCMDCHGIESVTSFESSIHKPSDANNVLGDKDKKSLEGYVEKLRGALRKL
jgi:hypothetical protein